MKTYRLLVIATALVWAVLPAWAEEETSAPPSPEIQKIEQRYQEMFKEIERQAKEVEAQFPKGGVNVVSENVKIEMKRHEIDFDIPEFKVVMRRVSFDVPDVTMKRTRIVWDQPGIKMELREVGRYPEINHFKVKWKTIKTLVPVPTTDRHEIKLDIPEIRMKRVDIKTYLPKVDHVRIGRIVYDLPSVNLTDLPKAQKQAQETSELLKTKAEVLAKAEQEEIKAESKRELVQKRDELEKQHEEITASLRSASDSAHKAGAEPSSLSDENGNKLDLAEELAQVEKAFGESRKQIDDAIHSLD